ncbi:MAG: hypothetical protein M1828_003124 [Chrysothrix sp. TS-e1954]|nr:MAG: hypothetical protein M1828_003124 [Chrysothrix sp. TS-e1954]
MEIAPNPLNRTFTAPTGSHARSHASNSSLSLNHQPHPVSQYSLSSRPSRSSDSTQNTSSSTLFAGPNTLSNASTLANVGVGASDNVINRVADKESSLFQRCVSLKSRLCGIPEFEESVQDVEDSSGELDPVTLLWETFRRGYPLMTVYNALEPQQPLFIDDPKMNESKKAKVATSKFLRACVDKLGFSTEDCFIISDLWGSDTTGFVKVARVVSRIADILEQKGLLDPYYGNDGPITGAPGAKRTHRQHVVDELVHTERTYVQHLELLQEFSKHVEQKGTITGDAIHDIFLNLNTLLDFQRRFLIRVESVNAQPESVQNWGKLFQQQASGFTVYEPYIENQKKCEMTAMREYEKLRQAGGSMSLRQMVESPTHLTSFLLKPFQRLSKYPLLLKELRDKSGLDAERQSDISLAMTAITSVLERTNAWIAKEERRQVVHDLREQVEDWKLHRVEAFGELWLNGTFTVAKGDPTKESLRDYQMFLFDKILLCCKPINPNKQKAKMMKQPSLGKGKVRLQLKGRIFMQNVTETQVHSRNGSHTCQINWRGDEAIEHFVICFPTEEVMRTWVNQIDLLRSRSSDQSRLHASTSDSEFTYLKSQGQLHNPYREDDYGDANGSNPHLPYTESYEGAMSRNGSSTSLRSRSTTGESGPPMQTVSSRAQPMGFSGPPLTLRTHQLPTSSVSPGDRGPGASYFSPGAESPISSRTSSSSGMYPFPRQSASQTSGDHRNTAPAMGRNSGRESNGVYYQDGRSGRTPAGFAAQANRLRSTSSPEVQNNNATRRVAANAPPVPSVPSHLANNSQAVNRSQNGSPVLNQGTGRRLAPGPYAAYPEQESYSYDNPWSRHGGGAPDITPLPLASPGIAPSPLGSPDPMQPSQLKVKVHVPTEGCTMTLVVGFNISFQSLKDRIDAKLQRNTNVSLASNTVRLTYLSDDDFVSIQTDEDVQTAFETWEEQQQEDIVGQLGEIELFCRPV